LCKHINKNYHFDKFRIFRIDCAFDIRLKNQKEVEQLVFLLNKFEGINRGRYKKYNEPGSLYISSDSDRPYYKINFYNKLDEVQKEYTELGMEVPEYIVRQIQNLCRIEVQYFVPKLYQIMKEHEIDNRVPSEFFKPEISIQIIKKHFLNIIGEEDFYSIKYAKQIINSADGITERTKEKLTTTLELIDKAVDMKKAKEIFTSKKGKIIKPFDSVKSFRGCKNTYREYIKKIRELKINPVVIPETWGIDHIANPISEIYRIEKDLGGPAQ